METYIKWTNENNKDDDVVVKSWIEIEISIQW